MSDFLHAIADLLVDVVAAFRLPTRRLFQGHERLSWTILLSILGAVILLYCYVNLSN